MLLLKLKGTAVKFAEMEEFTNTDAGRRVIYANSAPSVGLGACGLTLTSVM